MMESLHSFYLDGFDSMGSTLPTELGLLTNLNLLDLTGSSFGGRIPDEFFHLRSLDTLYLSDNQFSGTIGSGLGLLTLLIKLKMSNNNFTGNVPSEISRLTSLEALEINGNPYLTGSMPEEYCEVRSIRAEIVADCLPKADTGIPILSCPSSCCTTCL
jgi:Leucine-rich repeat (LRR) protein